MKNLMKVCLCTTCMLGDVRGLKWMLDTLKQKFQVVVNYHMGWKTS